MRNKGYTRLNTPLNGLSKTIDNYKLQEKNMRKNHRKYQKNQKNLLKLKNERHVEEQRKSIVPRRSPRLILPEVPRRSPRLILPEVPTHSPSQRFTSSKNYYDSKCKNKNHVWRSTKCVCDFLKHIMYTCKSQECKHVEL